MPCKPTALPIGCGKTTPHPSAVFPKSNKRHFGGRLTSSGTHGIGHYADHATGIVIGETAVVEDDVSILAFRDPGRHR